jgi:hypothetical protein
MTTTTNYRICALWRDGTWTKAAYAFPSKPTRPTSDEVHTVLLANLNPQHHTSLVYAFIMDKAEPPERTDEDFQHPNMMAYPIFGADDDHMEPGLYLALYNGRRKHIARHELEDQGFDGPLIGPLENYQTTYSYHIKLYPAPGYNLDKYFGGKNDGTGVYDLHVVEDELEHDGCCYGDWSAIVI